MGVVTERAEMRVLTEWMGGWEWVYWPGGWVGRSGCTNWMGRWAGVGY